MADKMNAAKSIRVLANLYRDMTDAADVLEQIGSIEQAQAESRSALNAIRADIEVAKADLAELNALGAKAKQIMLDEEEAHATSLTIKHAEIVKAAEEDAAEILKNAQDKAADMLAQSVTEKSRLSSEIAGLQRAIEAARAEITALATAREESEAEFDQLSRKLGELKAQAKAFIG